MNQTKTPPARTPLATHRFAANISQIEFADRVGLHVNGLRALERGRSRPRLRTAQAISRELGVPITELWPEEDHAEN